MTLESRGLLIGDKKRRMEMDGGEQLGRHLSVLDSGAPERRRIRCVHEC